MISWLGRAAYLLRSGGLRGQCALQDLQPVSQSSLSQVYSSLIPQVAFQITFSSIAASAAQASQVQPQTKHAWHIYTGISIQCIFLTLSYTQTIFHYASNGLVHGCSCLNAISPPLMNGVAQSACRTETGPILQFDI